MTTVSRPPLMGYVKTLSKADDLIALSLADFVPSRVYDFHAHLYDQSHFSKEGWRNVLSMKRIDCSDWRASLKGPAFHGKQVSGLFFGLVRRDSIEPEMNGFIRAQVDAMDDPLSHCLRVVTPRCDPASVAGALGSGRFKGIKVYHCYAERENTFNAEIPEYAPEWMWELVNEVGGVVLLHLVLPRAVSDERNQRDIRYFCQKYPRLKLVLAHAARCFSHRHKDGMARVAELPNVYVDTSAVCESASLLEALRRFGPERVLYGSDFFISQLRGRCVSIGDSFHWLYADESKNEESQKATLVGLESLLALREAVTDFGGTRRDVEAIFWNNAVRCLGLEEAQGAAEPTPAEQWKRAREVISCGTGLLSKRAEMFGTPEWPVTFSKAEGCRVWDSRGRMYHDFTGGVGAVLLGYADREVNRAVTRRLMQGSYCTLLAGEEVALAERLLALHPGMGKVRYARGGGDAMAVAVRVARAARGKSGIAFCGYHGWHDWYLASNLGYPEVSRPVPGLDPAGVPSELAGTARPFLYNDGESLRRACALHGGNLAAVVMEPLRSQYPTPEFLEVIGEVLRETGALLIVDEVTSGLRFGYPGISAKLGLPADLLVYAKAMSNGIPFGVVVGSDAVMGTAEGSFISSSYWTDGLGPAAALAVLEKMERHSIQERLWRRGCDFQSRWSAIIARFPGLGLSLGAMPVSLQMQYQPDGNGIARRVGEEMLKRHFLIGKMNYLMDAHRDEDYDGFLKAFEQSLEVVEAERAAGRIVAGTATVPFIGRLT